MFKTTVKSAFKVPGLDFLHIIGVNSNGSVSVGDKITDGEICYSVAATPLVHRINGNRPLDEVDICVSIEECDIDAIIGQTLYSVH